ncbi:hypothetical protein B0H16DRAFT_1893335 [Mycena metata]|uniref:Uncharacterized protein n=1 Tax=Mycena metata TaxID=1033252 RepID=A0AAD7HYY7_9AGAR|nr:hypothetical protein B0H16DRAFT_1893335 [Mycena metata]
MPSKHSAEDQKLIASLPMGIVTAFRSSIYRDSYIATNSHLFINNDWIDSAQLRDFIKQSQSSDPQPTPPQPKSPPTRVKIENDASDAFPARPLPAEPVKTRILRERTREVLEILSDSDSDSDCDTESTGRHRCSYIPDDVNEPMFVRGLAGQPLVAGNSKDTPPCSGIVHPTTGLRRANCPHSHIVNGHAVTSAIIRRPCSAYRTIFVPVDASIRIALIVHTGDIPHNHPIPVLKKASIQIKESYRQAIRATGTVGATVMKVDNAPSTHLLLGGKTPAEFAPALQDKRVKRRLVHDVKMEQYPAGLDVAGAFKLFYDDMKKPIEERYIHRLVTVPDGGTMIITCLAALMGLLDDTGVTSFDTDTTFKRIAGEMNEWEVVIFFKALQRAVTIARGYRAQTRRAGRPARNTTRQSTTAQNSRESHDAADERAEVEHEIQALQAEKQDATAKLKELRTRKSALSKKSKRSQTRSVVVSASSSGRVKTRTIVSNSTPPRSITPAPTSPVASTSTLPLATPYYSSPPTMAPADNYFLLPAENEFLSNSYFPQTSYTPSSDFGVYAPLPAPSAFGDYGGSNFDFDFNLLEQFGYVPMDNIPPVPAPTFPQAVFAFDNASPAPLGALTMPGFDTTTLLPSDPATATSSPGTSWPRLPPVPVSLATPPPAGPPSPPPIASHSNKRKLDGCDPANIIESTRARKVRQRKD